MNDENNTPIEFTLNDAAVMADHFEPDIDIETSEEV